MRHDKAHAMALSLAAREVTNDPTFLRTLQRKGFTLSSLARRLGVSPACLSMYRSGARRIPMQRAIGIQVLTGYPALPSRWPLGIKP